MRGQRRGDHSQRGYFIKEVRMKITMKMQVDIMHNKEELMVNLLDYGIGSRDYVFVMPGHLSHVFGCLSLGCLKCWKCMDKIGRL